MADKNKTKTKGTTDEDKQAEVDKLLANPNRSSADDKRLDQLLHGENPVITGDVSVDPVGVDNGNGTGLTDRASIRGEGSGDDVHREIPNPNDPEAQEEPKQDATEAGSGRAGSNENKRTFKSSEEKRKAEQERANAQSEADKKNAADEKAKKEKEDNA